MRRDLTDMSFLGDGYVICICEGASEEAIMDLLLNGNQLVFKRNSLVGRKITRRRKASEIESLYLQQDYTKAVRIVRVLDSKAELFELSPLYKERFPVYDIYTCPEIEMLLVYAEERDAVYRRKYKTKMKPSEYCSTELFPGKNVKSKSFLEEYFSDTKKLVQSIKAYHQKRSSSKQLDLSSLLHV